MIQISDCRPFLEILNTQNCWKNKQFMYSTKQIVFNTKLIHQYPSNFPSHQQPNTIIASQSRLFPETTKNNMNR